MEQCNVQHAIGGLEAMEGFLFTTTDLTKQMKPSFALPPHYWRGHVAVKRQQNRRKEGRRTSGGRGRYSNIYVLNLKASFLPVKTSSFHHAKVWSPKAQ